MDKSSTTFHAAGSVECSFVHPDLNSEAETDDNSEAETDDQEDDHFIKLEPGVEYQFVDPDAECEADDWDNEDETAGDAHQRLLSSRDARSLEAIKGLFSVVGRSIFTKEKFLSILLRYRLNLVARTVTLATVSYNFQYQEVMFNGLFAAMKAAAPNDEALTFLKHCEHECAQVFALLNTDYKMTTYLINNELMVPPQPIFLGRRWDTHPDPDNMGTLLHVQVPNTFQYISILETLKFVFKFEEAWECLDSEPPSGDEYLRGFRDGTYFKAHRFLSTTIKGVMLQFFFDEFGVVNPLGSKSGHHKLGAVYWTIQNLPAAFRSRHSSCFLAALFYSVDLKTYSFDAMLKPLIADLRTLQEKGITVTVNSKTGPPQQKTLKGTITQIVGDNLGINALINMNACFGTGTYFCRFCELNKRDIGRHFREVPGKMRTIQSYNAILAHLAANPRLESYLGVRGDCCLNQIPNFHVMENYPVSLMHDFFHGFVEEVICLILDDCIRRKCFTLVELNSMVRNFDYGHEEAKNKPGEFTRSGGELGIRLTFTECACLMRLLPQIVGGRVNAASVPSWNILLKLLDVSYTVFAPAISPAMVEILRDDIEHFLKAFTRIFPRLHFIPKMHLLTHYPSFILKLGPLMVFSEMRYEAKHHSMKPYAGIVCNFTNIGKTLASRHQMGVAYAWIDEPPWNHGVSSISKQECLMVKETPDAALLSTVLNPLAEIKTGNIVVFRGVCYRQGGVLVCGVENSYPVLYQIKKVYVPESLSIICVCRRLHVIRFYRHMYGFEVEKRDDGETLVRSSHHLFDYHPVTARDNGVTRRSIVSLRHAPTVWT